MQGGLGNQLSQWYFAHSIAIDSCFRFDPLYNLAKVEHRNFELAPLMSVCPHIQNGVQTNSIPFFERVYFRTLNKLWEFKILRKLVERLGYFREDPRSDQMQSKNVTRSLKYARGYFQKHSEIEKVFECVRTEMFPIIDAVLADVRSKLNLTSEYTVIHVRRGDYASIDFTPVYIGTLSDQYFIEGSKSLKNSNLLLLTENQEDVKSLVQNLGPCTVLDKTRTSPWETLAILAGATQFLGSNSSLSWWGARLCFARGGQVWLPEQWSYWKNIDPNDYHFPGSNVLKPYWIEDELPGR